MHIKYLRKVELIVVLVFFISPCMAGKLIKCTDSNGNITFTNVECDASEDGKVIGETRPSYNQTSVKDTVDSINRSIEATRDLRASRLGVSRQRLDALEGRSTPTRKSSNSRSNPRSSTNCISRVDAIDRQQISVGRKGKLIASVALSCKDEKVIEYAKRKIGRLDISPGRKAKILTHLSNLVSPYPSSSEYRIDVSKNDTLFRINGELFEAQTYCFNMEEGDDIIFAGGSPLGVCASATLINVRTKEKCEVWCK